MMESFRKAFGSQSDLYLVILVLGIMVVLFSPIPSPVLDFLLLLNFCFAMLILLLTFYMAKPVEFSTFPSLLLIATLFRLSLNIAATRLILSDADAGKVINAIGAHVVGGNYVIGLIVFLILVVVQYVVITNGAQRVSEVAARFTLDSMPGQQMSIDADLNMGFIDQEEAKRRRKLIEKEAGFYGAMDGASKFVKGDAIAGIIIMLINIIGGLIIGVMQLGMSWGQALQTYTLLTVGDGIVTQVPALVIAVGTGIIVTRSASDTHLSAEVYRQITSFPKTLALVAITLTALMFLPGIPVLPGMILLAGISIAFFYARKSKNALTPDATAAEKAAEESGDVYSTLTIEPIEVFIGEGLVSMVSGERQIIMDRIEAFRKQYALEAGFVVPKVHFKDDRKLAPSKYEIRVFGATVAGSELLMDRLLAIHSGGNTKKLPGIETRDPSYGLPAFWIEQKDSESARSEKYTLVDPETVFITHLSEIVRQQAPALLTRGETENLVNRVRKDHSGLVDELIPTVLSLSEIQHVLQNLLREKVSIRNMELILEVLVDSGRATKDPQQLTEIVRQRMGSAICQPLISDTGFMHVLTFDSLIEQTLAKSLRSVNAATSLVLEPRFAEQLLTMTAGQVEKMMKNSLTPVLLCAPELRRHVRTLTERVVPHLRIISMNEVPNTINLKAFGSINV
jgi:flagellar biosynthesis protein FlhA